jgi:hypothetical protein
MPGVAFPGPMIVPDLTIAVNLAVAGLAGLAIGVEREWSGHARGPHARFAGVRTLFAMGLLGGIDGSAPGSAPNTSALGAAGPDADWGNPRPHVQQSLTARFWTRR